MLLSVFMIVQLYEVVRVMENGKWLGSHDHEFNASTIHVINQRLSAENGDLLFLSAGEYTQTVICFTLCLVHCFVMVY